MTIFDAAERQEIYDDAVAQFNASSKNTIDIIRFSKRLFSIGKTAVEVNEEVKERTS